MSGSDDGAVTTLSHSLKKLVLEITPRAIVTAICTLNIDVIPWIYSAANLDVSRHNQLSVAAAIRSQFASMNGDFHSFVAGSITPMLART